ncbi:MAG TPA: HEAT repeat domain-containing protein, partial [Tepidisphaeraceae bacterium]
RAAADSQIELRIDARPKFDRQPVETRRYDGLGEAAAPYLARALRDPARSNLALNTLESLGSAGATAMGEALRTDDSTLRFRICERLAAMSGAGETALPALGDLLDDPDPLVRLCALRTIDRIGAIRAYPTIASRIRSLAGDPIGVVRVEAQRIAQLRGLWHE